MALTQSNIGSRSQDALATFDKLRKAAKPILSAYYRPATLEVTGGVHAGADYELPQKNLTIGSSYECDIVLLGDGLRPHHARIQLANALGQKLIVEALEDDIGVNEKETIGIGQTAELTLPATLELGGAVLKIQPRALSHEGAKWLPRIMLILFLLGGVGLFGAQWWSTAVSGATGIKTFTASLTIPQKSAVFSETGPVDSSILQDMRSLLEQKGLKDLVRLQGMPDGAIVASGSLDENAMGRWRAILRWYDGQKMPGPIINQINSAPLQNDAPPIASIWMDKTPQAMGRNGELAGINDTIGRGWRVTSIGETLSLERNGQTIHIKP